MSELPPEILDHVFIILRLSSDLPSLRACIKVSSLFRSLAERHLYYHLTLSNLPNRSRSNTSANSSTTEFNPKEVLDLLTNHPHIAAYVRSLQIRLAVPWRDVGVLSWIFLRDSAVKSASQKSTEALEDICNTLLLLTHLERIVLHGDGARVEAVRWRQLSIEFRREFVDVLALNGENLKSVDVSSIEGFPLEVLSNVGGLERVRLEGCFSHRDGTFGGQQLHSPNSHLENLQYLTLQDGTTSFSNFLAWLTSSTSTSTGVPSLSPSSHPRPILPRLSHFSTTLYTIEHYTHLSTILSTCKGSLEVLVLDPGQTANLTYNAYAEEDPPPHLPVSPDSFAVQLGLVSESSSALASPSPSLSAEAYVIFALGALPALCDLTLKVAINVSETFWVESWGEEGTDEVVYSTPFAWVRKVLDGILSTSASVSPSASGAGGSSSSTATAASPPSLRHLTLDITLPSNASPYALSKIRWSPLTSALAYFCSHPSFSSTLSELTSSGSSRQVEVLLKMGSVNNVGNLNAGNNSKDDSNNTTRLGTVVNALNEDGNLIEFIEAGVVHVGIVGMNGEVGDTRIEGEGWLRSGL
ncbi:hypothetical protein CVT26_004739 [Gymnopilus dilepis]|uniref:F-box domain-containing protein n=1 Tax=Gymnopilus dilepis TaxID=231916 RepID=A0A409XZH6_9AGAR|nr:hypothetical protein CVT26_004739 [Gymnopilus dilepis]